MATECAQVFVSWSGEWGHRLARAVTEWIEECLGGHAWTSAEITPGGEWLRELNGKIVTSRVAIICVTPEALRSPWVNYEIGALSALMRKRDGTHPPAEPDAQRKRDGTDPPAEPDAQWLFPLLFGVDANQLSGPLASVQSTRADEATAVERLASRIRAACALSAKDDTDPWQSLERRRRHVPPLTLTEAYPGFARLFRRKTFDEPVEECVAAQWLARYDGARETLRELRDREEIVARCCRPYVVDAYKRLVIEVDKYAMAASTLIGSAPFEVNANDGRLRIEPAGLALACERGRKTVKRLVARLLESIGPVFEEAVCFQGADSPGERASLIANRRLEVEALVVSCASRSSREPVDARGSRAPLEKPCWLDLTPNYVTFGWIRDQCADKQTIEQPPSFGPVPTVETRWRRSAWVYDRILFAVFLVRRIQLAEQDQRPIDQWTVQTAVDQLCLEIEDPCRGCGMVREPDTTSRIALEHAIRTLAVLAVLAPRAIDTAIETIEQRRRLQIALELARQAFEGVPPHEAEEAITPLDLLARVLLMTATPGTAGEAPGSVDGAVAGPARWRPS
jgi:hypothetical protein